MSWWRCGWELRKGVVTWRGFVWVGGREDERRENGGRDEL